ncbi:vitamin K epoxide reductase family protein [Nonomuraea sp. NPDC003754]
MRRSPADTAAAPAARTPAEHDDPYPLLLPRLLLVGGALGLVAAFVLAVEKIALLKNPAYVPSCSINPVLSCGSVMNTPQAEAFGFPNPLLGVAAFACVTTAGAALLAGARFRRWFWLGLQAGVTFGVVFVHWLVYQSLYVIGALCPYCMVVWAVTIPLFWYVTLHNLRRHKAARALAGYHTTVLTVWFIAVITMIGIRFWSYWSTLI